MALTGFVRVNDDVKNTAAAGFSISNGNSPFIDEAEFEVTEYTFVQKEENGVVDPKSKATPVLITTIGNLFLRMLTRRKIAADGSIKEPNGTFNIAVRECIAHNSGKSDGEILTAIIKLCKGKKLAVKRTAFATSGQYGPFVTDLIEINFK